MVAVAGRVDLNRAVGVVLGLVTAVVAAEGVGGLGVGLAGDPWDNVSALAVVLPGGVVEGRQCVDVGVDVIGAALEPAVVEQVLFDLLELSQVDAEDGGGIVVLW